MGAIVSQTDINKLLQGNPYLQFLEVAQQQAPTSLIDMLSNPQQSTTPSFLLTENFPGMEPRNIAEYTAGPDQTSAVYPDPLGTTEQKPTITKTYELKNTIADTLYSGGKFADKDFSSILQSLSGGASNISNTEWQSFLGGLDYVGEKQLGQYLQSLGIEDTSPYLSTYQEPGETNYAKTFRAATAQPYGTSGKKGSEAVPLSKMYGPLSPWMEDAEKAKVQAAISRYESIYPHLLPQPSQSRWYDTPFSAAAAPMMWASEGIGDLVSNLPNLAKLLVSPSMALYGGVKESRGIIDSLENVIMPLVSSYYTGSPGPGIMQAGAHNLARKASTGEDTNWERTANEVGGNAAIASMIAGPLKFATQGMSQGLTNSGLGAIPRNLITSLGSNLLMKLPAIIDSLGGRSNKTVAVAGNGSSEGESDAGVSGTSDSSGTVAAKSIADSLSNPLNDETITANIRKQLSMRSAERGGGNVRRMLKRMFGYV